MTNLIILPSSVNQAAIGEIKVHLIGKGDNCDLCWPVGNLERVLTCKAGRTPLDLIDGAYEVKQCWK